MSDVPIQEKINKKFENSTDFFPFITEIRFPVYKSLQSGTRITFKSPITALVGPNGTNKSSILQAISASPEGRSLADFWFSTEVDDIDKGPRRKAGHRFIYKYRFDRGDTLAECRKYRGNKPFRGSDLPKALVGMRDPDYWEPTKKVAKDDMEEIPSSGYDQMLSQNRDRWNQIKKPVLYLDFRSELSAFDKFIHHQSFDRWAKDATQKRHRAIIRSRDVAAALEGRKVSKKKKESLIRPVRELDKESVLKVSTILGKPIERICIVEHKYFGPTGCTVKLYLEGTQTSYSEAHAGSGEYAVVRLVDAIKSADKSSLILLDEPEVSLHPGAQVKLLEFIREEVLKNGHQVIFSTHSPTLVEDLPEEAVKVLGFDQQSQSVVLVADRCSATEAFASLGQATSIHGARRVIVEDDLAEAYIKASLRKWAPAKLDNLEIVAFPGGADGLVKNVLPAVALSGTDDISILLDGDQRPDGRYEEYDMDEVLSQAKAAHATRDLSSLKELWETYFHKKTMPNLYSNSDHGNDEDSLYKCILWASEHLDYLPNAGMNPEETLALFDGARSIVPDTPEAWKIYWKNRVAKKLNLTELEVDNISSVQIGNEQVSVLASMTKESEILQEVYKALQRIVNW